MGTASGHAEGTLTTGIKETEDETRPGISQSHIMMLLPNALGLEYICVYMYICVYIYVYIYINRHDSAGE